MAPQRQRVTVITGAGSAQGIGFAAARPTERTPSAKSAGVEPQQPWFQQPRSSRREQSCTPLSALQTTNTSLTAHPRPYVSGWEPTPSTWSSTGKRWCRLRTRSHSSKPECCLRTHSQHCKDSTSSLSATARPSGSSVPLAQSADSPSNSPKPAGSRHTQLRHVETKPSSSPDPQPSSTEIEIRTNNSPNSASTDCSTPQQSAHQRSKRSETTVATWDSSPRRLRSRAGNHDLDRRPPQRSDTTAPRRRTRRASPGHTSCRRNPSHLCSPRSLRHRRGKPRRGAPCHHPPRARHDLNTRPFRHVPATPNADRSEHQPRRPSTPRAIRQGRAFAGVASGPATASWPAHPHTLARLHVECAVVDGEVDRLRARSARDRPIRSVAGPRMSSGPSRLVQVARR